ncbi:cytosine methylase [Sulfolobales archaeon SCGC AB-777_K20]|nr:cytosine methylase [Sulfolobales archaeon SCGC AB-777_K20]
MQTSIDDFLGVKYRFVLFRNLVKLRTNYATHDLYPYPAKFIPNVVRYFIEAYTKPGETLFDPFAGSGTVAIEAEITGRNYILWDLNPIIEILVKAETWKDEVSEKIFEIDFNYSKNFIPKWENLGYWHPKEFIDQLAKLWAYYHDHPNPLVAIPLFKITKYFSYAELEFPKLYKSKVAIERVNELLKSNWKEIMRDMYWKEVEKVIRKVKEFQSLCKCVSSGKVYGGIDVMSESPPNVDAVITSPPYLQAQEYIRTFKIELYWLGYDDNKIKELSRKEIPYNKPPNVEIRSKTFKEYLDKIKEFGNKSVIDIYVTYFRSLAYFFGKVNARTLGIFVGPVKVRTLRVPIDEILKEHLESLGWKHEATFIDKIVSRRIKEVEKNPATKLEDERTPTEHLLIMKKE